jgi:hypothetical protein
MTDRELLEKVADALALDLPHLAVSSRPDLIRLKSKIEAQRQKWAEMDENQGFILSTLTDLLREVSEMKGVLSEVVSRDRDILYSSWVAQGRPKGVGWRVGTLKDLTGEPKRRK